MSAADDVRVQEARRRLASVPHDTELVGLGQAELVAWVARIHGAAVLLDSYVRDASAAVSALEVIAIVLGAVIVLAAAGTVAWLVHRSRSGLARSDRPGRPNATRPVYQLAPRPRQDLEAPGRPALEPGREIHLHLNVTADQLAAIIRNYTEGER